MHMKNGSIARATAVVIATAILCGIVPMIGVALRDSAIATMRETNILQALAALPEGLRDCSTILAYLFSTVGCIAIVAALAAVDLRITGSRRVVIRDVVVSAVVVPEPRLSTHSRSAPREIPRSAAIAFNVAPGVDSYKSTARCRNSSV